MNPQSSWPISTAVYNLGCVGLYRVFSNSTHSVSEEKARRRERDRDRDVESDEHNRVRNDDDDDDQL